MIGLKVVCLRKMDILNTECDVQYDTNIIDLDYLKMFVKLHFVQSNDRIIISSITLASFLTSIFCKVV